MIRFLYENPFFVYAGIAILGIIGAGIINYLGTDEEIGETMIQRNNRSKTTR